MKEENFVTSIARVWFLQSDEASYVSTTVNFLSCRTNFFSFAFLVTIKRKRTASQGVLEHITQYACLWLNQQAGKTNLKDTNIGDIKHKWEYFQTLEPFQTKSPEDGFI